MPGFPGKRHLQIVLFVIFQIEIIKHYLRNPDRSFCLASTAPFGIKLPNEFFTLSRYLIFKGKPCHIKNDDPAVFFEYPVEHRSNSLMIKIQEALTCRDHIKRTGRKIDLFGRCRFKSDTHSRFRSKPFCLFNLLGRDVRSDPLCPVPIHVTRQYACACTEVQNLLTGDAKTSVCYFPIKLLGINVPISGIVFRGFSPVKGLALIDPLVFNIHIRFLLNTPWKMPFPL